MDIYIVDLVLCAFFFYCYGTSNVSVGGSDYYPKSAILYYSIADIEHFLRSNQFN